MIGITIARENVNAGSSNDYHHANADAGST